MTWRDHWRPIIAQALEETEGKSDAEIRRALRAAWPAKMPRQSWPYKMWLDEIARQRKQRRLFHVAKVR